VKTLVSNCRSEYKSILSNALKEVSLSSASQVDFIFSFSIVMKYIDRTIDHLWSIFDNLLTIRNRDE
ncbi:MAG: hypothetical protein K2O19_00840, partial [Malacoplasma sp.]|nr:hypothetical protein [Malacoplasma sp.]